MSQAIGEGYQQRNISLLLLAGILLLILFLFLGLYKSTKCTNLCISNFTSKGNYAITTAISYDERKLPEAKLLITINDRYKSILTTTEGSNLQFQAPLNLGINLINVKYGNSESSVSFFYMGGMLYILLVPLGAIFFFLIKLIALDSSNRNKQIFHFNEETIAPTGVMQLKSAFDSLAYKNKRAVANLPEKISDILAELSSLNEIEGLKKIQKDDEYASKKMEVLGIGHVLFNCVGCSPLTKRIIGARIFYENVVLSGSSISLKSKTTDAFIHSNNIVFWSDLFDSGYPDRKQKEQKINLILFGKEEEHALSRLLRTYSKFGAGLLVMKLNNLLKVTTC